MIYHFVLTHTEGCQATKDPAVTARVLKLTAREFCPGEAATSIFTQVLFVTHFAPLFSNGLMLCFKISDRSFFPFCC